MDVNCAGCGLNIGTRSEAGASLKARRVDLVNGRIRVKCAKCHKYTTVPGFRATRDDATAGATPRRRMVAIKLGG